MEVRSAWCCGNARCLGMAFRLGDREKAALPVDRLALKARRAQPVEPSTHPVLEATAQDLARRAQVPVPQLYLAERVAGV